MSPPGGGAGGEQHLLLGEGGDGFPPTLVGNTDQFARTHLFEGIHQNPVVNHCLVQHSPHGGQLTVNCGYTQPLTPSVLAEETVLSISAQASYSNLSQFV